MTGVQTCALPILSRQLEEGVSAKDANVLKAVAASVPQAALDVVSFRMIPGIQKIFGSIGRELTEQEAAVIAKDGILGTMTNAVKSYGPSVLKTAGIEGTTEAGQQFFERLQAGLSISDEDARREYLDNFVGGAILGGALAVPGRAIEKAQARQRLAQQKEQAPAEQVEELPQVKPVEKAAAPAAEAAPTPAIPTPTLEAIPAATEAAFPAAEITAPVTEEDKLRARAEAPPEGEYISGEPQPKPAELADIEKDRANFEKQIDALKKGQPGESLWSKVKGKLIPSELAELGEPKRLFSLRATKGTRGYTIADLVANGDLDPWLPPNYRKGSVEGEMQMDPQAALDRDLAGEEHIKEMFRSGNYLTFDTQQEIKKLGKKLSDLEDSYQEHIDAKTFNDLFQEAVDEQRRVYQDSEAALTEAEVGATEPPARVYETIPEEPVEEEYFPDQEELRGKLSEIAKTDKSGNYVVDIPIDQIEHGESATPGGKLSFPGAKNLIQEYANRPTELPAIDVVSSDDPSGKWMVVDGSHRLEAARLRGQKTIDALVSPHDNEGLDLIGASKKVEDKNYGIGGKVLDGAKLAGGGLTKLARLARAPAKSKEEIRAVAERIAPQMTGEFVRGEKGTQSVAGETQKQFAREKELKHDIRGDMPAPGTMDYEKLKDQVVIGIAGDPTITGKSIHAVGEHQLDSPSPQHGGPLYGLGRDDAHFWASQLGAAKRVQNLAREVGQQYEQPVLGQYIMMGPESINYAMHYADANLSAIDPTKMSKRQLEGFNNMIRRGSPASGPRPGFPGIENKEEAYLQMAIDPELRKHFNALMQMPTVTEKFGLPSGIDVRHAVTEPALRDLETGVTGFSVGQMRPEIKELNLSAHPTYSHDIPGHFLGQSRYPIPYEIMFPDTLKAIRENPKQAPHEFGSLKMVGPRQTIDQQMIDEIRQYEEMIKSLTGKKKGGQIKKAAGGEITADDLTIEERPL